VTKRFIFASRAWTLFRHSCFVILIVRVYSRDSGQIFAGCVSSRSRGTFGVRTACPPCAGVLASLLGEKAVDRKSDAKTPRTPNSEGFRETALPATAGSQCKMPWTHSDLSISV
jgi:hypothetical protein